MARHVHDLTANRSRSTVIAGLALIALLWIGGLLAGFYSMLSTAARFGCAHNDKALACRNAGSALSVALVVAVVAIVTAATLLVFDAQTWPARLVRLLGGLVLLGLCLLAARAILATV